MTDTKPTVDELRKRVPFAELRVVEHTSEKDDAGKPLPVIEVHWDGKLVMAIYVSRSPGVRVMTKYPVIVSRVEGGLGVHAAFEPSREVAEAMEAVLKSELGEAFNRLAGVAQEQTDAMLKDALAKGMPSEKGKMN
jgi:hypothetical protein